MGQVNIFGFTLLRNGVKYDYSFNECLLSLKPLCNYVQLALGDSEDDTEDALKHLDFLKITPTIWDKKSRDGAVILSEQTNLALSALREKEGDDTNSWGIYLQCDEVFHEEDYKLILNDIQKANDTGCDVITFRYLHFWMDHQSIAINKKWYPLEIRAIKLKSSIESWGDAQSFRNYSKVYQSEARIFHYGHVREDHAYKNKKEDILRLYHEDQSLKKYQKKEKKHDAKTVCLDFFGNHPYVMKERIERLGGIWELDEVSDVDIVGNRDHYSENFLSKINAKQVYFWKSLSLIPKERRGRAVVVDYSFLGKLLRKKSVPYLMKSKIAIPWGDEFRLMLLLSAKKVGLKA